MRRRDSSMTARRPPSVDANRSACGCASPQPGASTPSTHHGWGCLRLVWENSCDEKRKWQRRAASIVLHFVYERGMMDWRDNTINASQPSTPTPPEHHWWACPCSIWANSMIGMRKLSCCQCRNMWQLIGGKESLTTTGPMCIFTPRWPCRPRRWVLDDVSRA